MGVVAIIVKIMPDSPDTDLKKIVKHAEEILKKEGAMNISFEEKPIAFGLKALYFKFAWQENKDSSIYEEALSKIKDVSSVQTEDYRRAFG